MSLSVPLSLGPLARPRPAASCNGPLDARGRALEYVAGNALHAPSVHGSQPWRIELHADHLALRADPYRQGRELVQSAGAALFSVRVALAERGWASETDRLPHTDDPDLLAVVRPAPESRTRRWPRWSRPSTAVGRTDAASSAPTCATPSWGGSSRSPRRTG
jgi:hypothetical protein